MNSVLFVIAWSSVVIPCAFVQAEGRGEPSTRSESARGASPNPRSWDFLLGTYLWATALNGNATIDGRTIQVDATFIDVVKATDSLLALDVLFVARKGRWGFLVDPLYMKVGADGQGPFGIIDVSVSARIVIAETTGIYTFLQKIRRSSSQTAISIDAILGLRIWWIGLSAEGSGGLFSPKGSQTWVDPLAGLVFRFDLARGHVPIVVRGDFDGWGVGSTFAWAATASVGYRWLLRRLDIGLDLAYRALGPDYSNTSKGIGWDVIMHGPTFALVFGF